MGLWDYRPRWLGRFPLVEVLALLLICAYLAWLHVWGK